MPTLSTPWYQAHARKSNVCKNSGTAGVRGLPLSRDRRRLRARAERQHHDGLT